MRVADGGTKRNHVPLRIGTAQNATFESRMYGFHLGDLAKILSIHLLHGLQDFALHIGFPTRVSTIEPNLGTGQQKETFQGRFQILLGRVYRSEEHTSELQSRPHLVCRLLLEKKKK